MSKVIAIQEEVYMTGSVRTWCYPIFETYLLIFIFTYCYLRYFLLFFTLNTSKTFLNRKHLQVEWVLFSSVSLSLIQVGAWRYLRPQAACLWPHVAMVEASQRVDYVKLLWTTCFLVPGNWWAWGIASDNTYSGLVWLVQRDNTYIVVS